MKKLLYVLFILSLLIIVSSCTPKEVHEHIYNAVVTDYTCSERGYTTYTCECGDSYVADYTEPAHRWGEWVVVEESTQQQNGVMERYCDECDAKQSTEDR